MKLQGKVALVTGSAIRVGKALALALARHGCSVVVHYGRSDAQAQSTAAEIQAHCVKAWTISADLGDERVRALACSQHGQFGYRRARQQDHTVRSHRREVRTKR